MKKDWLRLRLTTSPEQTLHLARLQALFAQACTSLGPLVQQSRCWNRVALHHLAYRKLREEFSQLGSQMACNVIYSVSRSARLVYQGSNSPWNIDKNAGVSLPVLAFGAGAPVYFDRHTLSIRKGRLSMFTLDGRMQFELGLEEADIQRFHESKLREVVLNRDPEGFFLSFQFGEDEPAKQSAGEFPEYIFVNDSETAEAA